MTRQVARMTHASRFRAPSIPIESTASTWAGMATRDCYLATSVNQPGDAVVHQVRSRGRKAPGKRQVESSAAPKTHGASTGLTGLISGFGTKRPWRFRPMSALRLGCVKTCASRERAELFSPFSSFDCDCQCCSFPIQRNRDKRSTRKFAIGVFTQPRSLSEVSARNRDVRFPPVSDH